VFVEQHRRAVSCIETNLELTGFSDQATVVQADAISWVQAQDRRFDLVLADPPYADDDWVSLLDHLDARWVVAEAGKELGEHPRWDVVREKAYGTTVVTVLKRVDPTS
jgi:16S rRNA G966 N2-methylase RsmD